MATTPTQFGLNESLISALLSKQENAKGRNLQAAMFDREQQQRGKDRMLQRTMQKDAIAQRDREAQRDYEIAKMRGAGGGSKGGSGRTEAQTLADLALAAQRDAKAEELRKLLEGKMGKLAADTGKANAQTEAITSKLPAELEELFAKVDNYKSMAKERDALLSPKQKEILAQVDKIRQDVTESQTLTPEKVAESQARVAKLMNDIESEQEKRPSEIEVNQGRASVNRARASYFGAQANTIDAIRDLTLEKAKQAIDESKMRVGNYADQIENRRIRTELAQAQAAWEKEMASEKTTSTEIVTVLNLAKVLTSVDQFYGERMEESHPALAAHLNQQLDLLLARIRKRNPDLYMQAVKTARNEKVEAMEAGGVLDPDKSKPGILDELKEFNKMYSKPSEGK